MRAIIVEDEALMIQRFKRLSEGIEGIKLAGYFVDPAAALEYAGSNPVDIAFLDIELPLMNGVELAKKLRGIRKDILIVFLTAYDEYIRDFNEIGGDYYILKPYTKEILEDTVKRMLLLSGRQNKNVYVQTFGRFLVFKEGVPVKLTGKAKEILALIISRCGKEISNEEIYSTIWEGRPHSNTHMAVYYNALGRLRKALAKASLSNMIISTTHGQLANTAVFDCDYYAWKEKNMKLRDHFEGEFLSEYSWGETILSDIYNEEFFN